MLDQHLFFRTADETHERASDMTERLLDEWGEAITRQIIAVEIEEARVNGDELSMRYWKRVRRSITDIVRSDNRRSARLPERRVHDTPSV